MPEFIPFRATPEVLEAQKVLRDGVPDSMRGSLVLWIRGRIYAAPSLASTKVLRKVENNLDWPMALPTGDYVHMDAALDLFTKCRQERLLQAIHFFLQQLTYVGDRDAKNLDKMLTEGRSKWQVALLANAHLGLSERVPEGVQTAAEKLIAEGGSAANLLSQAWSDAYDFEPRDSSAYANAVKAVEAAGLPAMGLTRDTATLGDMARLLDPKITKREVTWRLPFLREHSAYPSQELLLGMLKTLYRGQRDRHGAEAYEGVTHDEAVAAVLMAVSLVGWFSGGLVQERDPQNHPA